MQHVENQIAELGDHVLLSGKTRHGKNRIVQHGEVWKVIQIGGPRKGIAVESQNLTFNTGGSGQHKWIKDARWLDTPEDCDFEIIKVIK